MNKINTLRGMPGQKSNFTGIDVATKNNVPSLLARRNVRRMRREIRTF